MKLDSKVESKKKLWLVIIFGFALIALVGGFYFAGKRFDSLDELSAGTSLPHPRSIIPFNLVDATGQPFTNKNLQGAWSLVFFGFTRCPDLCPNTMSELNKVYQIVQQKNAPVPQVIMVSIDSNHDKSQALNTYVTHFNKNFRGATGSTEQLEKLTQNLNILFSKEKLPGNKNSNAYTFDHSGSILLINPEGNLAAIFSTPHHAKQIAADYMKLSSQRG